jgi:hypothetical protein
MGALLLRLKNVPEDEYEEVCHLLDEHGVSFYETKVGFWGVGMAAIWISDDSQLSQAHALLNDYTQARQARMQAQREQALKEGEARTLASTFARQPLTFTLYLLAMIAILALSVLPFLGFA